jgi:hypothetical protein
MWSEDDSGGPLVRGGDDDRAGRRRGQGRYIDAPLVDRHGNDSRHPDGDDQGCRDASRDRCLAMARCRVGSPSDIEARQVHAGWTLCRRR